MSDYFRPVLQLDPARPEAAQSVGWCWFTHLEHLRRGHAPQIVPACDAPPEVLKRITAERSAVAGVPLDQPRIMGILNVTPDSFSDGGKFDTPTAALAHANEIAKDSDILDIGGESTRPGAEMVAENVEISRTAPVIAAMRTNGIQTPVSIDTRKSAVARAALQSGAQIINDVSGFSFDPAMAEVAAQTQSAVCLMHSIGTPQTMQIDPRYDDVVLDVYDYLSERLGLAVAAGVPASQVILDPGIGFGKTIAHNLALLGRLSLFHALGCPLLLGVSRKKMIGTIGQAPEAADRMPGSLALALHGAAQGVQILRVHDTKATKQALLLWSALRTVQ